MPSYTTPDSDFPTEILASVVEHARGLEINIISAQAEGQHHLIVTAEPFDQDQASHLGLTEV